MNDFRVVLVLALAGMLAAPAAMAQKKMYRCGSNYQDRPCDQTPVAPKPAAAKAEAPAAPQSRAAQQQQVRCEVYSRQMDELREKQKSVGAGILDGQIKSLETRMKTDSC